MSLSPLTATTLEERAIKKQRNDMKNEAKKTKNVNFTGSNRDNSNTAIAILPKNQKIFHILGAPIIFSSSVTNNYFVYILYVLFLSVYVENVLKCLI